MILEALYQIGKIQPQKSFLDDFIEDLGEKQKYIFKIIFDITDKNNIFYKGIDYEEYDKSKKLRYFYKKGSTNGTDKTPVSKIAGDISKTYKNKILRSVTSFIKNNKKNITDIKFFENLDKELLDKKNKIEFDFYVFLIKNDFLKAKKELLEKINVLFNNFDLAEYENILKEFKKIKGNEDISVSEGGVVTLSFIEKEEEKYIGDLRVFKEVFLNSKEEAYKSYYFSNEVISKSKDKYCYFCKENNKEVMGFVSTFKFYTVDKKGMVSGGFNPENAWKNYPVCLDCAIILDKGKRYAEEKLNYKFCGFKYMLIPQLIIDDNAKLKEVIDKIKKYNSFSLSERKSAKIEITEEKILDSLSKTDNNILFNFMFYDKASAAFKILLMLNEVSPTRLRKLIEVKREVDNYEDKKYKIFAPVSVKKGKETIDFDFDFYFKFIRDFFSNTEIYGNYDKDFLGILNNIFIGNLISYDLLLRRFMYRVRYDFLEEKMINIMVLKAYKIILYIEGIKQLNRNYYTMEDKNMYKDDFFKENIIFDDYTKRAVFLEGVLADLLLNIQYMERKAKPFTARLNGLKIDEKVAKRLLPEMINKLEEYDSNHYYRELQEGIAEYMLKSDFKKYSVDELSFYFTLGMTLSKYFKKEKEESNE